MILVQLRDAIIAEVETQAPSLREVKAHGGRFGLSEIKAAAAKSPSARVACLGLRDISFEGAVCKATALWGIFIVAADKVATRRDAVAMSVVSSLAAILPANCWGMEDKVDGVKDAKGDNLFSRDLDRHGIALWALTFNHQVDLERVDAATLDDFLKAYIDYDLAPADGTVDASDNIDLPQ